MRYGCNFALVGAICEITNVQTCCMQIYVESLESKRQFSNEIADVEFSSDKCYTLLLSSYCLVRVICGGAW